MDILLVLKVEALVRMQLRLQALTKGLAQDMIIRV